MLRIRDAFKVTGILTQNLYFASVTGFWVLAECNSHSWPVPTLLILSGNNFFSSDYSPPIYHLLNPNIENFQGNELSQNITINFLWFLASFILLLCCSAIFIFPICFCLSVHISETNWFYLVICEQSSIHYTLIFYQSGLHPVACNRKTS